MSRRAIATYRASWGGSSLVCFSSRRRHTRCSRDWSSDVCSSDLDEAALSRPALDAQALEALSRELERALLERLRPEIERVIEEMRARLAVSVKHMAREADRKSVV